MLRDYQQNAHDEVIEHLKKSLEPCLIEAPTGAGKSHIIAAIAKTLYGMSKKRILCLAPSKELVQQNHAKYLATGNQASLNRYIEENIQEYLKKLSSLSYSTDTIDRINKLTNIVGSINNYILHINNLNNLLNKVKK